jgi:hypothetical protein
LVATDQFLSVHGQLESVSLTHTYLPKRKAHALAWTFLFGGNGGALNPHLAFGELNKPLSAPLGRCRFSAFFLLAA